VLVGGVAAALDQISILIERRGFDDVGIEVKLVEILGDELAFGVVPRPGPESPESI